MLARCVGMRPDDPIDILVRHLRGHLLTHIGVAQLSPRALQALAGKPLGPRAAFEKFVRARVTEPAWPFWGPDYLTEHLMTEALKLLRQYGVSS